MTKKSGKGELRQALGCLGVVLVENGPLMQDRALVAFATALHTIAYRTGERKVADVLVEAFPGIIRVNKDNGGPVSPQDIFISYINTVKEQ